MAMTFAPESAINFGDPALFEEMENFTVSAWIYPTGWGTNSFGRIISKENDPSEGWLFYVNNSTATSTFNFYIYRFFSDGIAIAANNSISLSTWQHVAATYTSAAIKLYVNGVEPSYESNTAGSGILEGDTFTDLVVGNNEDYARGFDGRIEDVRIYNRVLTPAEIGGLYMAKGHDSNWTGLILRCPMREYPAGVNIGSNQLQDLTENKNHGTSRYTTTPFSEGIIVPRRRIA